MPLTPPPEVTAVLAEFDARTDTFEVMDVQHAVDKAVPDWKALAPDAQQAAWAEWAAFDFSTHEASDGGPWKTYFQPMMTVGEGDGMRCRPDLRRADAAVIEYWSARAHDAKHPVLKARYADLVWDTTKCVTKGKPGIEFARLAIDNYVAAAKLDDGSSWGDTHESVGRALTLALSVKDKVRIEQAVNATIDYVDRTASDDKLGTYCYLFDNLLPPDKGPELSEDLERSIVERMEKKFAEMTTPGGQWDVDPHSPQSIGLRLAAYYQRKNRPEDRVRILRAIGQAFERRAKMGDAMTGVMFLETARETYAQAGLKEEAERVQFDAQKVAPDAVKQLVPMTVKHEVKKEDVDKFCAMLTEGGSMEVALSRLAVSFVPDQQDLADEVAERAKKFPLQALFTPKIIDESHIKADIGDESGDPDGKMVHETSRHIQFSAPWIGWGFDHLFANGLTAAHIVDFVRLSPLFTEDRIPLIRRAVEAHILGDFIQTVHVLVPQIERAVVNIARHAGKSTVKPFQSGKGVMQSKNLQDALERDEAVKVILGENLRMYLLSTLAHNKGLNIRNEVCHGLWTTDQFTKTASERVLHILLSVSMLRAKSKPAAAT
ncbi:MAG: DUF4209 domain-containing protein [Phycisphaerales bacterium]|nr:DUF4209 domain-containing protein [Phycisphaerales bacterium]